MIAMSDKFNPISGTTQCMAGQRDGGVRFGLAGWAVGLVASAPTDKLQGRWHLPAVDSLPTGHP